MKVLLDECVDQHLPVFNFSVIVLRANSNRLADLHLLVPEILAAIPTAKPGVATFVGGHQK